MKRRCRSFLPALLAVMSFSGTLLAQHGTISGKVIGSGGEPLQGVTVRYGEVSVAGATATNATGTLDQTYGAKTITDLSASYTLRRYTLALGADNVFDVYPDRNLNPGDPATGNGGISNFGIFPYAGISPFGFNGRFLYTKVSIGLR